MSFLTRTSTTTLRALRFSSSRAAFSTSTRFHKDPISATVDTAKDTLKSIDRTVSDAAVKGIEKGQDAAAAARSTVGVNASKAEGSASEMAGKAKGAMNESTGSTTGSASEMVGEAKGKAQEVAGQTKGKAQEVAGQTKGNVAEIKGQAKAKANEILS
ncbi:hypothetical protein MMC13_005723 [Lambiella insularis]|nr:hypothetical protein [Lambiella insularis]